MRCKAYFSTNHVNLFFFMIFYCIFYRSYDIFIRQCFRLLKHTCSRRDKLIDYQYWTDKQKYFTYIKTHFGETILAKIRKLEKTMIKYSSYTNHLWFSLCCHHKKILPKDLQLKSRIKTEQSKILLQRAGKLLLQERIHINHVIHYRLKNSIEQLKGKILESITPGGVSSYRKDSWKFV